MSKGKTYQVTGIQRFRGHEPGAVFKAELDEAQERRALARGSISLDTSADALEKRTRDELNELAKAAGVEAPEGLKTKAAVATAIRARDKE